METNISVSRAQDLILARAVELPAERIPLSRARGRILREDVLADADSPRFDCSAVDGYGLRRSKGDKRLRLVGEIQAGAESAIELGENEAVRVFTGARVPDGADYVAMQEDVEIEGDSIRVRSLGESANIRRRGENMRRGDVVASSRMELRSAEIAALANCGMTEPLVTRAPRVVHLVTGDELIEPSRTPQGTQLRDSNSSLVAAFLESCEAKLVCHERLSDSLEASQRIAASLGDEFDLLLVSGGASVGAYDFARPMLEHAGFEIQFQNVNMRPGKPLALYTRGRTLALALPGNPVSHWVIVNLFIAPLLAAMRGASQQNIRLLGSLVDDAKYKPNRRATYVPAMAAPEESGFRLRPRPFVSSGDVASVVGANAIFEIPADAPGFAAGDKVQFIFCQ